MPEQALRHLGQRCYGIYLNHVALLEVLDLHLGFLPDRQLAPLWMGLVLVVAEVSYRGVEAPLLALAPSSLAPPPDEAS